ncbi:MAG: hypothetical protein M3P51_14300 [Chloroflexota bacterium]|nr:hypothetical protein [Chloroflexota bacterium]
MTDRLAAYCALAKAIEQAYDRKLVGAERESHIGPYRERFREAVARAAIERRDGSEEGQGSLFELVEAV